MRRILANLTAVVTVASLAACSDGPTENEPSPRVSISPGGSIDVPVGGTVSLTATVSDLANADVTWAADCGEIAASGAGATFTAPWGPRSCAVTATSVAAPTVSDEVTIDVVPLPNADNVLAPAGFDTDFTPFEPVDRDPPVVEWSTEDARGSSASGAVLMHHDFAGNNGTLTALDFCFTAEPGAVYRAGGNARFLNLNSQAAVNMSARVFTAGCGDFQQFLANVLWTGTTTEWTSDSFTFTVPEGAPSSIRISLGITKEFGNDVDVSALVDDLFVTRIN
jgi:hypothetical protein